MCWSAPLSFFVIQKKKKVTIALSYCTANIWCHYTTMVLFNGSTLRVYDQPQLFNITIPEAPLGILIDMGSQYFVCLETNKTKYFFAKLPLRVAQPVKMDLNKKSLPKQKTIQTFKVDTLGFRITIKENPPAQIFSRHFWGTSPAGNRTRAFGDLLIRSLTLYQLLHWGERNSGQKF